MLKPRCLNGLQQVFTFYLSYLAGRPQFIGPLPLSWYKASRTILSDVEKEE